MATSLSPYLFFRDDARAAMEFYRSVFGGELTIDTFAGSGVAHDPAADDLVLHAQLQTPEGLVLMASDTPPGLPVAAPAGFAVSLSGEDEATLTRWWRRLGEGGTVTMPLEAPPWGGLFGMVTDRFGIGWMVSIAAD